jgi:hypothetical protein
VSVNWIDLVQNRNQRQVLVNMVINLRVPLNVVDLFTS